MLQPPDMDCCFCSRVHERTVWEQEIREARYASFSYILRLSLSPLASGGGVIESVFLPVPEYVGGDRRLPDTVAGHEFQFRRQISWGMESVFLHLQRVRRRWGFSLDIWENGLYLYWNPSSGGIAWNHETARQVIP